MSANGAASKVDLASLDARDREVLARLRACFLDEQRPAPPYWNEPRDLALYDASYGRRIAWKWDHVLAELDRRGWRPAPRPQGRVVVVDWGCGSGIAGRAVAHWLGGAGVLRLHDRSELAVRHAHAAAASELPMWTVDVGGKVDEGDLLVVSHALGELDKPATNALLATAKLAGAVLWVEPGTHLVSRQLGAVRAALGGAFEAVAPCTHQAPCGALANDRQGDWCHTFAKPAAASFHDGAWMRFIRDAGIDPRSLPLSYLVMERQGWNRLAPTDPHRATLIGRAKWRKPVAQVLLCKADGLAEANVERRPQREAHEALAEVPAPSLWRWTDPVPPERRVRIEPWEP